MSETQIVNSTTAGFQGIPAVAATGTAGFVVAWYGYSSADPDGAYVQRYSVSAPLMAEGGAAASTTSAATVTTDSLTSVQTTRIADLAVNYPAADYPATTVIPVAVGDFQIIASSALQGALGNEMMTEQLRKRNGEIAADAAFAGFNFLSGGEELFQ